MRLKEFIKEFGSFKAKADLDSFFFFFQSRHVFVAGHHRSRTRNKYLYEETVCFMQNERKHPPSNVSPRCPMSSISLMSRLCAFQALSSVFAHLTADFHSE